jgi:hypothetical protein
MSHGHYPSAWIQLAAITIGVQFGDFSLSPKNAKIAGTAQPADIYLLNFYRTRQELNANSQNEIGALRVH